MMPHRRFATVELPSSQSFLARRLVLLAALALTSMTVAPARLAGERASGPTSLSPTDAVLPSQRLGVDFGRAPQVTLGVLDLAALHVEDARRAARGELPRLGAGRPIDLRAGDGAWLDLPDGRALWVVELVSPSARGLRLHFTNAHLAVGSVLAVSAAPPSLEPAVAHRYLGGREKRTAFWSPPIDGEAARIEYLAPIGASRGLPFRLDFLNHRYEPAHGRVTGGSCQAGSCKGLEDSPKGLFTVLDGGTVPPYEFTFWVAYQLRDNVGSGNATWMTAPLDGEPGDFHWRFKDPNDPDALFRGTGLRILFNDSKHRFTIVEPLEGELQPGGASWLKLDKKLAATGTVAVPQLDENGEPSFALYDARKVNGGCPAGQTHFELLADPSLPIPPSSAFLNPNGNVAGIVAAGGQPCFLPLADLAKNPLIVKGPPDDVSAKGDTCRKGGRRLADAVNGPFWVTGGDTDWFSVALEPGQTAVVSLHDSFTGELIEREDPNSLELALYTVCPPVAPVDRVVSMGWDVSTPFRVAHHNDGSSPTVYCIRVSQAKGGWSHEYTVVVSASASEGAPAAAASSRH
jgi:hypothetical protein